MSHPTHPFRFAVISDPHVALPHTLWQAENRFHLVEVSIPALEQIFQQLCALDLDFLLLPGDLVQHGERENHAWLAQRLNQLPFPAYVVPGNHDVIVQQGCDRTLSQSEFPQVYQKQGYEGSDSPQAQGYHRELLPGLHLVTLNSNRFEADGQLYPVGWIGEDQCQWLKQTLEKLQGQTVWLMLHHNLIEHLPGQSCTAMGQRYMVANGPAVRKLLNQYGVQLIFTGHLHVQDIARQGNLWEITTGSLVSYPHPYRIIEASPQPEHNRLRLRITSPWVASVPDWPTLQARSRDWMAQRSPQFMVRLLTNPPLNLPQQEAVAIAPQLSQFWSAVAAGDTDFDCQHLPQSLRPFFSRFNGSEIGDNQAVLDLGLAPVS